MRTEEAEKREGRKNRSGKIALLDLFFIFGHKLIE